MFSSSNITCRFELLRATRIFHSGDPVCGKITLTATKKTPLEGIILKLIGLEHTQWTELMKNVPISYDDSSTHNVTDNKIHFSGSKEHILTHVQLNEATVLQPGEFVAQFNFNLPDQLLPSCKQSHGGMDYYLQVVLQRRSHGQKIFQKRLFLRNRVDLNMEPHLKEPSIISKAVFNNEIGITVPQTGFVPGQLIPFSITMTHLLYRDKIVINLCQKTVYTSQMPTPKSKEVIKVHDCHIVTTAGSGLLRMPFPAATSTTVDNALMKISYYVECLFLNEKLEVVHRTLFPITIGTVALQGSAEITTDESHTCLHSYDNLVAMKNYTAECAPPSLMQFDFTACETQKCSRYKKRYNLTAQKKNLQHLCMKLYSKVIT